jgi:uncharacterized membrane protein YccC
MPSVPNPHVAHALRMAVAAVVCLLLAEWLHLQHGNLAVWTTHMVLAQYVFTAFQKSVERVGGRAVGIGVGLVILTLFGNAPVLVHLLMLLSIFVFFYAYFSGRLQYTWLNAGLYLNVIVQIGRLDPPAAVPEAKALLLAMFVGLVVADFTVWISGTEGTLQIHPGGEPFFPVRGEWVRRSLMLVVTVELTQILTRWFDLPTSATIVSVMMITTTPDLQSMIWKGEMRLAGAGLALVWGLGTFALLSRLPHLILFAALLFGGMFLAAYLARAGGDYSYAGIQMGLVLPLIVVVPPSEFGELGGVIQRLEGVIIALASSVMVAVVWAAFSRRDIHPACP